MRTKVYFFKEKGKKIKKNSLKIKKTNKKQQKHHCRLCGKIFCKSCSNYRMPLPQFGYKKQQRVCVSCYSNDNYKASNNEYIIKVQNFLRELPYEYNAELKGLFKK